MTYELLNPFTVGDREKPIKAWTRGVSVEQEAARQLENVARMPFIHSHVAVMPDVHYGIGATVGSVMAAQVDLVDVVHTLKQVLCVKG